MRSDNLDNRNKKEEKEESRRYGENSEMPGLKWVDGRSGDRGEGEETFYDGEMNGQRGLYGCNYRWMRERAMQCGEAFCSVNPVVSER